MQGLEVTESVIFQYKKDYTLHESALHLNLSGYGIAVYVDDKEELVCIVTDGDLRRGIINNHSSLLEFGNFSPDSFTDASAKKYSTSGFSKYRHSIAVCETKRVKNVFLKEITNDKLFEGHTAILMVGGLGTRLGKLTINKPKPMLEINGRPLLEHTLNLLKSQGFRNFFLCTNYLSEVIEDYFGSGVKLGVNIEYVKEKKRLGTAGALSLLNKTALPDTFVVMNGDLITGLDFNSFIASHKAKRVQISLAAQNYKYQVPYGVLEVDKNGKLTKVSEKPFFEWSIASGIYCFNKTALEELKYNEYCDMPDLLKSSINMKQVACYSSNTEWIDIGNQVDFELAQNKSTEISDL